MNHLSSSSFPPSPSPFPPSPTTTQIHKKKPKLMMDALLPSTPPALHLLHPPPTEEDGLGEDTAEFLQEWLLEAGGVDEHVAAAAAIAPLGPMQSEEEEKEKEEKKQGSSDGDMTAKGLGHYLFRGFMEMAHEMDHCALRKSLAILRAVGLCARDVSSDIHHVQAYLEQMCPLLGLCDYETLLYDQNLMKDLQRLGEPASRKQKRMLEPSVCDPFISEIYNGAAPAMMLILSNGQKR